MPPPREPRFERRLVPQAGARREKHEVYTLALCVPSGRERDPSAGLQGENAHSQGGVEGHLSGAGCCREGFASSGFGTGLRLDRGDRLEQWPF
jgi:hypothetical protein